MKNFVIVENVSGDAVMIKELKMVIPFDNKHRMLPYDIAIKYKSVLKPISVVQPQQKNAVVKVKKIQNIEKKKIESENVRKKLEIKFKPKALSGKKINLKRNKIKKGISERRNKKSGDAE